MESITVSIRQEIEPTLTESFIFALYAVVCQSDLVRSLKQRKAVRLQAPRATIGSSWRWHLLKITCEILGDFFALFKSTSLVKDVHK